eukprot:UN16086
MWDTRDSVSSGRLKSWIGDIAPQYEEVLEGGPRYIVTTTLELQEDGDGKDDISQLLQALRSIALGTPTGLKFKRADESKLVDKMNDVFGTVNMEVERLREQKAQDIKEQNRKLDIEIIRRDEKITRESDRHREYQAGQLQINR